MRSELGQVTNRQLSDQAYYAAESGINDAVAAIQNGFTGTKTDCGPVAVVDEAGEQYLTNSNVGDSGDTNTPKWTCLLIDPKPTSLEYGSIDTVTPTTFVVTAQDSDGTPATIDQLDIYWQGTDPGNTSFRSNDATGSGNYFPNASNWSAIGMLRVAVTPLTQMDRTSLVNNTFTSYLYPTRNSTKTSTPYQAASSGNHGATGVILDGACSTSATPPPPRYCHSTISKPAGDIAAASTPVLFALRSIYDSTNAYITALGTSSVNPSLHKVELIGAQTVVDSTGRAQDILKRLQVRVPQHNGEIDFPGFTLDSLTGICKQLTVYPGYAASSDTSCKGPNGY
jgi:hypothetical protein